MHVSESAAAVAKLIHKNPTTVAKICKATKASQPKTVYRWLHQLHAAGYDVVRRGFEATGDIRYSVDKRPSRKKAN